VLRRVDLEWVVGVFIVAGRNWVWFGVPRWRSLPTISMYSPMDVIISMQKVLCIQLKLFTLSLSMTDGNILQVFTQGRVFRMISDLVELFHTGTSYSTMKHTHLIFI
jgi:hypothetical protein